MSQVLKQKKVPKHLKKWVVDQNYDKYTPIDQAVWRYVMRRNHNFLKDVAHETYTEGLIGSGININSIPRIEEMNDCLEPHGIGAVTIDGFIPAVAFFGFQANGILPIASEIRQLKNILYTPAPDIIHEAAGHAPILCNKKYAEFVKLFGTIGSKAIATKAEHEVFEAARALSNMMETGTATDEEIEQAKTTLQEKQKAVTTISEAEHISRFYWWTVEFGMIGTVDQPIIYGAGLLSSVGESANSLTDKVKKLPFELQNVIDTGFDITTQQPQLFVCKSFDELIEAVHEFSKQMAYVKGGTESLIKALESGATATVEYSSGLQVSGTVTNILKDDQGDAIYFNTTGETALSVNENQLTGHGTDHHHHGFGSPIGKLSGIAKALELFSEEELSQSGLVRGNETQLKFESGVHVSGTVKEVLRHEDKIVVITFENATVEYNGETLFKPDWGVYDMAVGATIPSVFGGAADPENFFGDEEEEVNNVNEVPAAKSLTVLDKLYGTVREIREGEFSDTEVEATLVEVIKDLRAQFPNDWLLRLEIVEILSTKNILNTQDQELRKELDVLKTRDEELNSLIVNGLKLI